jgi:two-component system, OmpR family, sensor kinase
MNLRAIRVRMTLLFTLLSAVAVAALAVIGVRVGTERIDDGAAREAELKVGDVIVREAQGSEQTADNTWIVHIEGEPGVGDNDWTSAVADNWVEPPLMSVGSGALEWDVAYERFEQDGTDYLAFGKAIDDHESAVTAVELTYYQDRASSLRLRLTLAAIGTVLGIAVIGWFVSGRALAPIRAANARQRDFIADAAHEMRTPLAVIRASASQALSKPRGADEYVGALNEIESASESAGAAVNELLELARIDSGQFAPRLAPLRLDLLAEEVVAGIRVDGCTLAAVSDEAITVDADYALLRHAVENVVRNAAARSTEVTVRVVVEGKRAAIEVVDNGPGFAGDLLPDVFERFRRGDKRGSSGLGLAIAKSIVTSHKGDAEAKNLAPGDGGGAVVRLVLPLSDERR